MPRRILLLEGGNAQGKTTLLEALFYGAAFSSPLVSSDKQLINFKALNDPLAVGRIVIDFERDGQSHELEVRLIQDNTQGRFRREILMNGAKTTAQKCIGSFSAVLFLPQMTRILEGPPDERRRCLNIMLAQSVPGYARALSEYARILTQRNALLKTLGERGGDRSQLDYWDELLGRRAAVLILNRRKALTALEVSGSEAHSALTNGQEKLRFIYQPSFDPETNVSAPEPGEIREEEHRELTLEEASARFVRALHGMHENEIERGVTLIGPHRDDFSILGNDLNLGQYGSRGQIRTALLSLKMAEIKWMEAKLGSSPLLLLDETLAELDAARGNDLLNWLENYEQAILTTADVRHFPAGFISRQTVWQVEAGNLKKQAA